MAPAHAKNSSDVSIEWKYEKRLQQRVWSVIGLDEDSESLNLAANWPPLERDAGEIRNCDHPQRYFVKSERNILPVMTLS